MWQRELTGVGTPLGPAILRAKRGQFAHEAVQSLGKPVVPTGLLAIPVHALLDDNPFAAIGDDKAVQVQIEPVLHRSAVDLRDQAAGIGQCAAVEPDSLSDRKGFSRCLPGMLAPSTADVDAKFASERRQAAFQRGAISSAIEVSSPAMPFMAAI